MGAKRLILPILFFLVAAAGCTQNDGGKGADGAAPTVPNGLAITAVSPVEVKVAWKPSHDDVRVMRYKVYRNGAYLKTTDQTSTADAGLKPQTRYCYRVTACDASGKESGQSTDVCAVL
ncbi:MAG: fibronectin type III domain-containing protein [Syntrophales bacterium]